MAGQFIKMPRGGIGNQFYPTVFFVYCDAVLGGIFISSIDILINFLPIFRDAQFIIAFRKPVPKCVTNEVVNIGVSFAK